MANHNIVLPPGYDYGLFFQSLNGPQAVVDAIREAISPDSVTVRVVSDDLGPDTWFLTFEGSDESLKLLNHIEPALDVDEGTVDRANIIFAFSTKLNKSQCDALLELYERLRRFIPTAGYGYGVDLEFGSLDSVA